jgi:hypothetical protein
VKSFSWNDYAFNWNNIPLHPQTGSDQAALVRLVGDLDYIGNSHYWVCDGARAITPGQMQYFTEWQPNGNGVFTTGWNTMDSPGVLGGIGYLYFHMNWGWGGNHDGWFAFNNVNSGNGNYQYARQNFYITKP